MWFFRKGHLYDKTAIQAISSRQHSVHSDYKHSTRAELMEYDDPIVENDSEFMETERDMDLMDTDDKVAMILNLNTSQILNI